jgi:hypothetical protein
MGYLLSEQTEYSISLAARKRGILRVTRFCMWDSVRLKAEEVSPMSSHDQETDVLRNFVLAQVRKMLKQTHDEARLPSRTHQVRQAGERRCQPDRRKQARSTPERRQGPVDRRKAIGA